MQIGSRDENRAVLKRERARYLAGEISHDDYYLWLAKQVGVYTAMVPFTPSELLSSTDPYFNDLPLRRWDSRHPIVIAQAHRLGLPWSQSDTVCCLKAVARRAVNQLREEE